MSRPEYVFTVTVAIHQRTARVVTSALALMATKEIMWLMPFSECLVQIEARANPSFSQFFSNFGSL
jgi:hypothetical protein